MRLKNCTEKKVIAALDKGAILRTHVLRPTWHLIPGEDIYWMLALTAPRIKASARSRHRQLGLTDKILKNANQAITDILKRTDYSSREELATHLTKFRFNISENRLSHLLLNAELDGLICSGPLRNGKQTYSLIEKRVANPKKLTKEQSLETLATRYFQSHGPASVQDFSWWSGLSLTEAKQALEMISPNSAKVGAQIIFFLGEEKKLKTRNEIFLLPAFDEFVISYKDRSASLDLIHTSKSISANGIFKPVIIRNGLVKGLWKRSTSKNKVKIETEFFMKEAQSKKAQEKAEKKYSEFLVS
jgi:hypothetical protein